MLTQLLARNAAAVPSRFAIVQGQRRIRYGDLYHQTARMAARLKTLGIRKADPVAILLPNCPEFVIAFFAVMKLHAVAMPLSPHCTAFETSRHFSDKPPRAVITDQSGASLLNLEFAAATPILLASAEFNIEPLEDCGEPFSGDALYLFTSGSAGSTKRVPFTQRNLFFEALNFVESTRIGPNDHILCPVPLFHSYGLCLGMLDAIFTGATLVLEAEPDAPFSSRCEKLLELLRTENIRLFPAVPWQFSVLAEMAGDVSGAFQQVTWCMSSGEMLPRRTYDRFLAKTGRRIRSFYGSTEAGSVAMETGPEEHVRFETVGSALKNVELVVRDPKGEGVPAGESGFIWIRSPALTAGYDDDAGLTGEVFRDGWYNSGDLGHLDPGGRLFLAGRKQSIISIGSYKVDATEVEETLLAIPGVREAAVVGVQVSFAGTMVKAVIGAILPLDEKTVRSFCRQRLALFKIPRMFEFVRELPRDAMGKILRKELASMDQYVNAIRNQSTLITLNQMRRASSTRQRTLVMQIVRQQVAAALDKHGDAIPQDTGFADLGMDSFASMELVTRLDLLFGPGLSETFTFDYPSISAATSALVALLQNTSPQ